MLRRAIVPVILIVLLVASLPLRAHDAFRIIGNVTKWQDSTLSVKDKSGYVWSIAVRENTTVLRDKKDVGTKELKAGLGVVVEATGDSLADLVADQVTIVPPIEIPPAKK